MEELVKTIRTGESVVSETTPLYQIAMHPNLDGSLLRKNTAAVEVLNLLRPTVAILVYIVLSAGSS